MIENENKPENVTLPEEEPEKAPESEEFVKPDTDNEDVSENVSEGENAEEASDNASNEAAPESEETEAAAESEEPQMVEIVGIRFKKSGKIYYFDPDGIQCDRGGHAIVETARGVEYGMIVIANRRVPITEIVLPLRKLLRVATPEDEAHHAENTAAEKEAFRVCLDKIHEHNMSMKLIDVEYTFDNNKLLFYFTADGRVDFRELVKDLASVFRTRIELRQIGIRDEAKLMGGLGVCGRSFCCHSFLGDFAQVSIKMAKEQNLSLNSAKISGACGRLMCCLRYENDVYEEEAKKLPRLDAVVQTPDGDGVVIEVNALAGKVRVKLNVRPEVPPKYFTRDEIIRVKGYAHTQHDDEEDEELRSLADEPMTEDSDKDSQEHRPQRQSRGERPMRDNGRRRGERFERNEKPEKGFEAKPEEIPEAAEPEAAAENTEAAPEAHHQKHDRHGSRRGDRNDRRRPDRPQKPRHEQSAQQADSSYQPSENYEADIPDDELLAVSDAEFDADEENGRFDSQHHEEKRHRPQRPRHRGPRNGHPRSQRPRRQNNSDNGTDN